MYSIHIQPTNNENDVNTPNSNSQPVCLRLNNKNHNQILLNTGAMAVFSAILILILSLLAILSITTISNSTLPFHINNIVLVVIFFIVFVMLPCIFYASNRNARIYVKRFFV